MIKASDIMRRSSRPRLILITIAILALIVSLWLIWERPPEGASHTANFTPQITSDNEAPDVVSARKRDTGRKQIRLEASSSAALEESAAIPDRRWPSVDTEKRRAVQSAIAGIVANSQDGTPIQHARLTASPAGSEEIGFEAVSGSGGRFQMTIRGAGRYTLRAQADGFRPYSTDRLLITPAEGNLQKNILMTPQVELRGRVVDHRSRGIAGASVWLREETPGPFDKKSEVQSDESGRFLMAKPPLSGTYFAEAGHPEYELHSRVPVTLPKDDEVVITVRRVPDPLMASISGHAWDSEGNHIHGAIVSLVESEPGSQVGSIFGESSTDPTGRFFFSKVRRGTYLLIAEAEGFAHAVGGQGSKLLTVEPSGRYELDLVLVGQTTVQGVVLSGEGLAVAQAGVVVSFEKGTGSGVFCPI